MQHSSTPWWRTDTYDQAGAYPAQFDHHWAGPRGVALVRAWPDGRTDAGWGLQGSEGRDGFMPKYQRGEFNDKRVLFGYEQDKWAFAFIMRSLRLVAIDIDGKNGGHEGAKKLGGLPLTMAETSKSGTGHHLFYLVDDQWDDAKGYALLNDRIGIEQGVDFRATGCIYHHKQQRWNHRPPAMFPDHLIQIMQNREQLQAATTQRINSVLANQDTTEVLLMHDEIVSKLKRPIPAGKRNNTLFAWGAEAQQAQVPQWQDLLADKALQVGLDQAEVTKLLKNIELYGVTNASSLATA